MAHRLKILLIKPNASKEIGRMRVERELSEERKRGLMTASSSDTYFISKEYHFNYILFFHLVRLHDCKVTWYHLRLKTSEKK